MAKADPGGDGKAKTHADPGCQFSCSTGLSPEAAPVMARRSEVSAAFGALARDPDSRSPEQLIRPPENPSRAMIPRAWRHRRAHKIIPCVEGLHVFAPSSSRGLHWFAARSRRWPDNRRRASARACICRRAFVGLRLVLAAMAASISPPMWLRRELGQEAAAIRTPEDAAAAKERVARFAEAAVERQWRGRGRPALESRSASRL